MYLIIAEDHPLLAESIRGVVQEIPGVHRVASVSNGRQLIDFMRNMPADLVLLDLNMPYQDGLAALGILKKDFPSTRVIIFTTYDQPALVGEVRNKGAHGYLLKTAAATDLVSAVAAVSRGETWFPSEKNSRPHSNFEDNYLKSHLLTTRETEIIGYVAEGLTTRQIAGRLFVSEFTINAHRRNIARKLGLTTAVSWVNFAREHGII